MDRLVLAGALCCLLALALWIANWRWTRRERLRMVKLRGSKMYADLYHLVRLARERELDQVRIERTRVTFTSVCPPGVLFEYKIRNISLRSLGKDRTRVLAEVLGEDIAKLNSIHYSLRRYRVWRSDGTWEWGYAYTLRPVYKARLLKSRKTVQAGA